MTIPTTLAQAFVLLATALLAPSLQAQTCTQESDCAQGMICHRQAVSTCTGDTMGPATCEPNTVCEPVKVVPPTCSESIVRRCVYPSELPCHADADCGDGFLCQPTTMTTCSGATPGNTGSASAGSTPTSSGGGAETGVGGARGKDPIAVPPSAGGVDGGVAVAPACTSSTSYPGWCRSKATPCSTDADCHAPLTCVSLEVPIALSMPVPADAGGVSALPPDKTGPTTPASKTCQSVRGNPPTVGDSDGTSTGGSPVGLAAGPDGGINKGTTKGTTPSVSQAPTPSTEGPKATDTETTATRTGSGGCSVGLGALPNGTLVLLGLAATLALLRRKRDEN